MYLKFFGLNAFPFKITPQLEMFYRDGSREQILEALMYTISRGDGILKVTGEVGSGKTMLLRLLATKLSDSFELVYINSPNLSAKDILLYACTELGIDTKHHTQKYDLTNLIYSKLLEFHSAGKRVVMLIDEAQAMTFDALEEIRLLSNIETNDEKLLQMVLFGQPELDVALDNEKIRQIKSRISYSIYVPPFNAKEVHAYLNYRMRQAGYKGLDVFTLKVSRRIQKLTGGLPRNINVIADKILMAAYGAGDKKIQNKHFKYLPQLEFGKKPEFENRILYLLGFATVAATLWIAYILFSLNRLDNQKIDQSTLNSTESAPLNPNSVEDLAYEQKDDLDLGITDNLEGVSGDPEEQAKSGQDSTVQGDSQALESYPDIQSLEVSTSQDIAIETVAEVILAPEVGQDTKFSGRIEPEKLPETLLSLYKRDKIQSILDLHVGSSAWARNEQSRYVVQLSTHHIASLDATLDFYSTSGMDLDSIKILIDFNGKVNVFRLKAFYSPSDSFTELNNIIENLPQKVRRPAPYVIAMDKLSKNLRFTDQKLEQVGIINESK